VQNVSRHIFLSYSRSDHPYASELAAYLADVGVGVWWDIDGLGIGERNESVIREAIEASAAVVVVLTSRSVSSDRVQHEISDASDVQKPILPLLLEPCPPPDIPERIRHLHHEDVVGGRMPGPSFVAQLLALAGPLAAAYSESTPAPRKRVGVVVNATVGVVAALGLVWVLVNQLPDPAGGSPDAPATPAGTPTAAVNAFISAAEVRDDETVKAYVCQRYQGVSWYFSDFHASNFIQAKLALVAEKGDTATANIELNFQVDGDMHVKGVQYSVVKEGGGWKVCGPA
jgi:TIR domain